MKASQIFRNSDPKPRAVSQRCPLFSVSRAALARRHPVAVAIEQHPGEQAWPASEVPALRSAVLPASCACTAAHSG
jgi:hypothetical protein